MVIFVQQGSSKRDQLARSPANPVVSGAIAALAESGVLRPLTLARRNRAWEAPELFELVDDVEEELVEPDGREPFGHS